MNSYGGLSTFVIDTSLYKLPLEVLIQPITRRYKYNTYKKKNDFYKAKCFNPEKIKALRTAMNCTNVCIQVVFRSLFNPSEIETCLHCEDYWCAMYPTLNYLKEQQTYCNRLRTVKKNFNGMVSFRYIIYTLSNSIFVTGHKILIKIMFFEIHLGVNQVRKKSISKIVFILVQR